MFRVLTPAAVIFAASGLIAGWAQALGADSDAQIVERIDVLVRQTWADNEIQPSERATDEEFARRAALDILGHIPSYDMLMEFLDDKSDNRREKYIDRLLDDPDYVRNLTNIWANMLVGRGGRRNNRPVLERWLRLSFSRNQPYDQFVTELVSATGTTDENGAVAFLAAHLNENAVPATSITSRVFLGLQVQCTQCHNHPFNDWTQKQFWSMNAFFRGTRRQNGANNQFTLVDAGGDDIVFYERRNGVLQAAERKFVDGSLAEPTEDYGARTQLAQLMTESSQPYLARTQVNRLWGHFLGSGFTRPVDDMGPHNPPSHPELLDELADFFRNAGYDNKRLIRWITSSEAYNLTSRMGEDNTVDDPATGNIPLFSRVYPKLFRAEQLYDSLLIATAADRAGRNNEAAENQRRRWLQQFVQTFGTDENDEATTFNGTIPQALVLMNGSLINSATSGAPGSFLRRVLESRSGTVRPTTPGRRPSRSPAPQSRNYTRNIPKKIETLFLVALSRRPTKEEVGAFNAAYRKTGTSNPILGLQDVFWAILNSNEFIINH